MCFSWLNTFLNKSPSQKKIQIENLNINESLVEERKNSTDKEILIKIDTKSNLFDQNRLDIVEPDLIVSNFNDSQNEKFSLISSILLSSSSSSFPSSSPSSLNSSITNLSINKMQSDNSKKLESLVLDDSKSKGVSKPFSAGFNFSLPPNTSNKLGNLELKIENLNTKKQSYVFNSERLVAKPISTRTEEDDKISDLLNEDINNVQHREKKKHHHHHHHNHHHGYKIKGGKLTFSPDQVYEFNESDIKELGQIGNGEFGTVCKVLHKPSMTMMAMKRIGPTVGNQGERKKVLKELSFVLECHENDYVVKFYGVKFNNEPADCLICMELMDASLEKFYKFIYDVKKEELSESFLGKVTVATLNALNYLKEKHKIIHRDVKPSNILVNRQGDIKMCDFGISGKLVDSIAASRDAGCQLYMAPERIDPAKACVHGYDVRSDVWSLGITLYELATGKFPYPQWMSIFHQLSLVVEQEAPRLQSEKLSEDFKNFVNTCLTKDETKRPKYNTLLQHPLVIAHKNPNSKAEVAAYVEPYINEMYNNKQY